jgi:5-methylcytosine-specific restriction endonuclease McrA
MHGLNDISGQRFGRLLVVEISTTRYSSGNRYWWCRCDCGSYREYLGTCLRRGKTVSCGCYRRELLTKHGMAHTQEYRTTVQSCYRARRRKARAVDYDHAEVTEKMIRIGHCVYCGRSDVALERDHVVPLRHGGEHSISNLVPACRQCNGSKNSKLMGDWLPEGWGEVCILSQPQT